MKKARKPSRTEERIKALEAEISALRQTVAALQATVAELKAPEWWKSPDTFRVPNQIPYTPGPFENPPWTVGDIPPFGSVTTGGLEGIQVWNAESLAISTLCKAVL